ncbi:dienelactone hydrolase family protein [Polyangium jinanense]|uniref:Dienelactone hydrolase family protein n=1 Tax=Polyangium jinanense TaxID=2829994 RepID=A0A9X3X0X0_9BACT|nr:dienelactone hydrolase family protein [Polyangium jinanense]MDC3955418.1 dienelactone hydrolase family protein [Polyangium jinanense]MDC3981719.1 dienelactone hydrolase family protein [Polyangium jinanense]
MAIELDGFQRQSFTHDGAEKDVYRRGSGPGVVIMTEMPGITPSVIRFAERVATEGYTVFLPQLFGTPGKPLSMPYALSELARACISREFAVLAANESSPLVDWLRALCRHVHAELGGKGVGAIGMCITGNFALSLMVDRTVAAPVLSQPSLPFGLGTARRAGMHISERDLAAVKERCASGAQVLAMRFTHDALCPGERFVSLRKELGPAVETIEIDSGPGNRWGIPRRAHSVVTNDLVDEAGHPTRQALDRVLAFFSERLRG